MLVDHFSHPVGEPKCIGKDAPAVNAIALATKYSSSRLARKPYRNVPLPSPMSIFDGSLPGKSYAS